MLNNEVAPLLNIADIKLQISLISQKPLEEHPQEFENVHNDLSRVLSGIDGL